MWKALKFIQVAVCQVQDALCLRGLGHAKDDGQYVGKQMDVVVRETGAIDPVHEAVRIRVPVAGRKRFGNSLEGDRRRVMYRAAAS